MILKAGLSRIQGGLFHQQGQEGQLKTIQEQGQPLQTGYWLKEEGEPQAIMLTGAVQATPGKEVQVLFIPAHQIIQEGLIQTLQQPGHIAQVIVNQVPQPGQAITIGRVIHLLQMSIQNQEW